MFLNVQKYLYDNSLDKLKSEFAIEVTESDNRIILNYSQCDSPKFHPIVRECRGLCLEKGTWTIYARSFPRFFNLNEDLEGQSSFDWKTSICQEKVDGSLALLYWHYDQWRMNTRGSFATAKVQNELYGGTWSDLFQQALGHKLNDKNSLLNYLDKDYTYVFELCSPYNQVVVYYPKPKLYLLGVFSNRFPGEYTDHHLKATASYLGIECPRFFPFQNKEAVASYFENEKPKGNELEGFVFRDNANNRIKLKSEQYLQLHRLSNNGNICLLKTLIPYIVSSHDDLAEALLYLPQVKLRFEEFNPKVEKIKSRALDLWKQTCGIKNQKEFALKVKDTEFGSILFNVRKSQDFDKTWNSMGDWVYEKFFKNSEKIASKIE